MRADLLPCPFCGSSNVNHRYIRDGQQMFCQDCGSSAKPAFHGPKDDTIPRTAAAWNRRAADALASQEPERQVTDAMVEAFSNAYHGKLGEQPTMHIWRDAVRRGLEAALASPIVPVAAKAEAEGWRLVPEVATGTMLSAGHDIMQDYGLGRYTPLQAVYRVMLAAAPTCEGEGT